MCRMFICRHCGQEKAANPRLKGQQQYCGEAACQRARKAAWQREKLAADENYRTRQKGCQKKWRVHQPSHQYLAGYRRDHPAYVERNREQQRLRNLKRREEPVRPDPSEKIVKMDTFRAQAIPAGVYELRPYIMDASAKIVKMDAFIAQIQPLSASSRLNPPEL